VFLLAFDRDGNVAAEFQLKEGINLIGITSVPDNIFPDVDLDAHDPDQIVSRRHAVITVSGDQYLIEDQRSTNGTWVNGQRLRPHTPQQLLHGDDIVFSQRVRSRFAVR
jgi:pSer/pThr/pTyr-binding forkhead associated (FHA) protein